MPEFRYIARNDVGEKVEGIVDFATEAEAVAHVSATGLFPMSVEPVLRQTKTGKVKRVSGQLLSGFYSQLSDLMRSGVPLLRALKILQDQTSNTNLKFVIDHVSRSVEEGETLADAMARYQKVFGEMGVQMVRAGSEGAFLEESLAHVADYTEAQDDLKGRIVGALAYPVVLLIFMLAIVMFIMVFLVPSFEDMFKDLRKKNELPMATEILLYISQQMKWIVAFGVPLLILGVIWFRYWVSTVNGRRIVDYWLLVAPIAGPVYQGFVVARFCRVLGTLLKNGVPIVKSLEIAGDATANRVLSEAIATVSEAVTKGSRLAGPLANTNRFPRGIVEMIAISEEANTLDTLLVDISNSLEKRNWRALDLAVRFIEPVMLIILGLLVLFFVLALLVPALKMSQV